MIKFFLDFSLYISLITLKTKKELTDTVLSTITSL